MRISKEEYESQSIEATQKEKRILKMSHEYSFVQSLKGNKKENWNWQCKERGIIERQKQRNELGSPTTKLGKGSMNRSVIIGQREDVYHSKRLANAENDYDPSAMEQELLEMDRQIRQDGGFLLKQQTAGNILDELNNETF